MARSSADRRGAARPAALGAALLLLALAGCAPKAKGPLLLHPVPPVAQGYALEQGAVVFTGPDVTVSARPWDWRLVEEEVRAAGGPSPFGEKEGDAGRFVFIRLRLENRSRQALVYNVMRSSLVRPGTAPVLPMETSDLYAFAREDSGAEGRARAFSRLCFDGLVTVRPGESAERYLAFPAPQGAKTITLLLDEVFVGKESYVLRFPFEVFPGK